MKIYPAEMLEKANPKEVPFWYWALHEFFDMLGALAGGFVGAIAFLFAVGIVLGVLATQYPQYTFQMFQYAVCAGH